MKGAYFLGTDARPAFKVMSIKHIPLKKDEVRIKVMACGICGTDVHIYHGEAGSAQTVPPVILGHEYSGIIVETGDGVTELKKGDHVTVDPNIYCQQCMPCKMGKKQECEELSALGVNTDGGFAEYSVCPARQCFRLYEDIDFDIAAMAEPLACVIHGIDRAQIKMGQTVLVIGGGAIGLLMVQMAKLSGASKVILSEPIEHRRNIGMEVGADIVIDPLREEPDKRVQEILGGQGADVVVECVGRLNAVEQAVKAAGKGATILLFGVPSVDTVLPLPLFDVYKKELNIVGSMINPDTHQRAVNLIQSGRLEIEKLITHIYDLEHLEEAILMQMKDESIKVIVHPWD